MRRRSSRRRRLLRQISALRREIAAIENGALYELLAHQTPAPACSLCEQAPPGKPGQPTDAADRLRPLRERLAGLEAALARLNRDE
jgi:hypothetical protein